MVMSDMEKAIKALEHFKYDYQQYCDCSAIDDAIALLKSQPQIVRCKDCKHYRYYGLSSDTVSECTIDHCYPDSEWFCADGVKKDDGA